MYVMNGRVLLSECYHPHYYQCTSQFLPVSESHLSGKPSFRLAPGPAHSSPMDTLSGLHFPWHLGFAGPHFLHYF